MDARTAARVAALRLRRRRRRRAPRRSSAPGSTGCASASRTPAGERDRRHPDARAGCPSTTRWPPRPSGSPPARPRRDRRAACAAGWARAASRRARPAARRDASSTTATTPRPVRCVAALDLLAGLPGRRVAVLGEMLELGRGPRVGPPRGRGGGRRPSPSCSSSSAPDAPRHRRGRRRRPGLDRRPRSTHVADREAALDVLRPRLRDGDTVLVKASRGIGLDLLVDAAAARARGGRPMTTSSSSRACSWPSRSSSSSCRRTSGCSRRLGFGKRIREEGPETHYVKEGTPTMGGLLIVVVVLGIYLFLRQPDAATFAPLAALAGVGLLGAFDDYLNARTGEGIQRPPEAHLADRRRVRRGLADPADLRHHRHRGAVRRRRADRPVAVHRCSRPSPSSPRPTA